MSEMWQLIGHAISDATNSDVTLGTKSTVSGGCINQAYKIQAEHGSYFVKLNDAQLVAMFEAEFQGLTEIEHSATIKVPHPICCGLAASSAFIVLEHLQLGSTSQTGMAALGEQLAALHRVTQPQYGWSRDNTIGSTPQINKQHSDWLEFWQINRLGFQLELAGQNSYCGSLQKKGDKLMEKMSGLFPDGNPDASLLHGDLWSGNMAVLDIAMPVIFDPAIYYGDRETDLAMTELFGGFSENFYRTYNEHFPLDSGYSIRKTFYNIYHILNHLNLFGGGYGQQAESMMDKVVSELG